MTQREILMQYYKDLRRIVGAFGTHKPLLIATLCYAAQQLTACTVTIPLALPSAEDRRASPSCGLIELGVRPGLVRDWLLIAPDIESRQPVEVRIPLVLGDPP